MTDPRGRAAGGEGIVTRRVRAIFTAAGVIALLASTLAAPALALAAPCEFWVAPTPSGNDANPGTSGAPWATMNHAAQTIPDAGCTVWFADGVYSGPNEVARRFTQPVTFESIDPYRAVLQDAGTVLNLNGATDVVVEGFELHHAGPGATGFLTYVDSHNGLPSENIVLRNNIFHDSYGNDLLKLLEASRFITIEGNVFSNAGSREQHIDVNSVTDVTIQDNVFFDAFELSGRANAADGKHDIVIKDSNESLDGLLGSQRITVRRNVFLNWEGGRESFVQVGNDGKSYYEAADVHVENNLMIGNGPNEIRTAFGVAGARDVTFDGNTVAGNLPTSAAYAFVVETKGFNPPNQNITFVNNVWSDPTGTMGAGATSGSNSFSDGDPATTNGLTLDDNLYWNGGAPIPPGDLVSPLVADARRVVADPGVNADQSSVTVPWWTGSAFLSGTTSIRREFERLVDTYGRIPPASPAIGRADPAFAPADDILGLPRDAAPDLGAYESREPDDPPGAPTGVAVNDARTGGSLTLSWDANGEPDLAGYNIYRSLDPAAPTPWTKVNGSLISGTAFTDTGLANGTTYWYEVTAIDAGSHESPPSASSSATPSDATPPAAPTGLAVTDAKTGGTLSLAWSANTEPDLSGYDVFRSTDPSAPTPWTKLNGTPIAGTTYTDTGLANGTTYWYYLIAIDATGNASPPSIASSGTPTIAPTSSSFVPGSVIVSTGTGAGDPVTNLAADDSTYFRVNAAKQGKKRVTDWYGKTTIVPSGAKKLTVVYDGSATTTVTQTLYLYRFSTASWVKVSATSVGTADSSVTWSTTSPASFVSPANEVRVRVSSTAGTTFTSRGDLMGVTIDY